MRDYDTSVAFLGEWGRFQVIVFFMLCSTILPNGTSSFSLVFVADTPAHHCLVPEVNLSQEWRETVIPMEEVNGELARSQCRRYRLDKVRNLSEMGVVPGRDVNLSSLEQEDCLDGWNYSRQLYQSTAVSEFDLVCNKRWRQPLTVTIFFLGVLVESFFSGVLSDRFGRKPVLFGTSVIQSVFSLALLASPSWEVFCVLLFCSGLGNISNYLSCYVLGTEILTGNARVVYASIGVFVAFAFGYMMLPLFAYFLRTWTGLTMANALLGILYMPLWWFLPESPMWLLSQGRVAEAETIVRKAAKMNRVEAPEKIFADYIINAETPEETFVQRYTLLDLLRRKRVAATTFIMTFLWFSQSLSYYGLTLNTSQLHSDPYISCFLSAVVELPAYFGTCFAVRFLPRRLAFLLTCLVSALSLFFIPLLPQSVLGVAVALEMLGKFAITAGTSILYFYCAELYPTGLRNTSTGMCSMGSRIGGCIAPFVLQLNFYVKHLTYVTMGSMAVLSAFPLLFMPESFGRPLPETLEQMPKTQRLKCSCIARREPSKHVMESKL
ncbi:solute carrier family 22 member 4-like isoform X1 [Nerophis ophidion]|uniref:solute carrier family 22 member 4-like isoform X1 n=1 Tax=Nerophis ophidion TaxID=159077 RepID=UPI002AE00C31|nr:solute carrier family 22 member 4-like isoform X1 [Nerophis ophidion]XP_061747474.1 solute carrier family 22 member 4-like isoform X1 [Nerophis ophidion]